MAISVESTQWYTVTSRAVGTSWYFWYSSAVSSGRLAAILSRSSRNWSAVWPYRLSSSATLAASKGGGGSRTWQNWTRPSRSCPLLRATSGSRAPNGGLPRVARHARTRDSPYVSPISRMRSSLVICWTSRRRSVGMRRCIATLAHTCSGYTNQSFVSEG